MFWRSFVLQGAFNYERMQNLGYCYSMLPAIKKLYNKKENQAKAIERHLEIFNTTSASIGFAIVIDQLMAALSRQKINISIETNGELIVYTKANQAKAILSAKEKRAAGTPVETILKDDTKTNEDYQNYAKRNRIRTVTFMED